LTAKEKIILGIDPGTNVMGYGVISVVGNKAKMMGMGVIDLRKMSDPYLRLGKIYDVIIEEIIENQEGTDEGLAIGRAWFEAPEVDGSFVVRYDLDDPKAVAAVVPGAMVKAKAVASSQVDIDGVLCEFR